jgi:predicted Rossmann fold flavoprotein
MEKQLVVIGGGAAGFFCAVNAARLNPSLKVTIVEKSNKILSKVKVSGGGRCNVTHACFDISDLVKRYPRGKNFLKKAFHWFSTSDTIKWFEERGVKLKTEADGRMFPVTNTSQTIIDCLVKEANTFGVHVLMNAEVKTIHRRNGNFELQLSDARALSTDYLCIASGGFPKSSQFGWLTQLGHTIEEPVPSLFTFNMPSNSITQLMGVSVEQATVKVIGSKLEEKGPLLITHWGMSGPAVLKTSAWGARELAETNYHFTILVNWLADHTEQTLRERWQYLRDQLASQKLYGKNPFGIPNRLWVYLLQQSGIDEIKRWGDVSSKEQNKIISNLTAATFEVKGKTTFKEEFVTCGGIKLSEIDANTMQSRMVPHLFFAGEVLDIDGVTGGFNFQNAWTTGWIAAKAIASLSAE